MSNSRQVRARQNRQKERIVEAHAERARLRRRRRIWGIVTAVILFPLAVIAIVAIADDDSTQSAAPPTTAAPVTLPSAADKPCVKVADELPAGAPTVDVAVGKPPTALIKKDLKVGTGEEVKAGATVTAHYIGVACSSGKIFDSSYSRGEPTEFPLTGVIKGWTDGIPGMKVGGRRLLGIPSDQAYGPEGDARAGIAPDEALWFVVEITKTADPEASTTVPPTTPSS
jgi:hypothetical protein